MIISIKDDTDITKLRDILHSRINGKSRFKCGIIFRGKGLKLERIRLKEKKRYCGNHPNACDIEGGRMGDYLEGADWVSFNDLINDVLDEMNANANVYTSVCKIRIGTRRRINYGSYQQGRFWQWEKVGDLENDYADYCGEKAPASEYPLGTPGEYTRV